MDYENEYKKISEDYQRLLQKYCELQDNYITNVKNYVEIVNLVIPLVKNYVESEVFINKYIIFSTTMIVIFSIIVTYYFIYKF